MRDIFYGAVLVIVSITHLLFYVSFVLLELSNRILFDLFYSFSLALKLCIEFVHQLTLLLQSFFLFLNDSFLYSSAFFIEVFKDLSFFLDSSILFDFKIHKIFVHLLIDWIELVIQALNPICFFLRKHVFECLHSIITSFVFILLILFLSVEFIVQLGVQLCHLFVITILVFFERIIDFLSFVNCILLDVFDFPKDNQLLLMKKLTDIHL